MQSLDYCPFCGYEKISIKTRSHKLGVSAHAECEHCRARGGNFIEDTKELVIDSITRDWNQSDLRPKTVCHKVKRMFVQLEYDLRSFYYKIKRWDF